MRGNHTYKCISINNLKVICLILDKYEKFNQELTDLMYTYNRDDVITMLYDMSNSENIKVKKKIKKFYDENKTILDIFNKNSDIRDFSYWKYDVKGNSKDNNSIDYFYRYLLDYKDKIDSVIDLLDKLKKLGFSEINFNGNVDFTDSEYIYSYKHDIVYLDNMEGIPYYKRDVVKYKTTNSNYLMELSFHSDGSAYKEIALNSLTFDSNRLPDVISEETIIKPIINLGKEKEHKSSCIRDSVILRVAIEELFNDFTSISKKINELENVQDKERLIKTLKRMKKCLDILQESSSEYDDSLFEKEGISSEVLEREKKLYLSRKKVNEDCI